MQFPFITKIAEDPLNLFAQTPAAAAKRKGDSESTDEKSGKRAKSEAKSDDGADGGASKPAAAEGKKVGFADFRLI